MQKDKPEQATLILDNAELHKIDKIEIAKESAKKELALTNTDQSFFQQMIATAKEVDLDKLKQLQEMYEHAQDREAAKLYAMDFIRMKSKLPKIIRLKANEQTKSKYAPLEDINTAIDQILEEHGFGTMHKIMKTGKDGVEVMVRLWHTGGHFEEVPVWMPIDDCGIAGTKNKTIPHAIASAVMYCRRVGQCSLLNISTGDADGNQAVDVLPEDIVILIKQKISRFEPDYTAKFLSYMKADSVESILAKDTKKAFNAITEKGKKFDEQQKAKSGK